MKVTFSEGDIIVNPHEMVVRLNNTSRVTMQAEADALTLIGGVNVISAVGSGMKWSIKLDNAEQLEILAQELGITIEFY
ncbi:DUF3389 domain-containing protein [Aliivibrio sp. S4TY2]|uniref:DUF3389 domain-containing protein n=1 Tax=unclassified Aliivibrio TaxID=2645654 RepID=UPI00237941F6|nr:MULTISPECIES: DUF3389 domain-containing protein [unclassified Aliivibrio]MDD9156833.1 DUF3389 domain-containing protein [Aliivibrio sp. S4TY2]MDD9160319.1 DUF3389 domain-containing protein [Aliivibrio sp. S4TY1]MDD9164388.1 DUF3389 domain-containing protein [Aliivibrio sp. S4MY2]MDD9168742.1 DUF3389 domain-containing protein [Aliivibrio sp. S4MY4]MDD9184723.1 DUF3389 domain-containing protein [Aliivibrio sp. S4MY3]